MQWNVFAAALFAATVSVSVAAAPSVGAEAARCHACGTVVDVDPIPGRDRTVGGGAVLGALVGGAVGHRLSNGRATTTVAGAAAGAAIGYNAAGGRAVSGYTITVHMDDGDVRTLRSRQDYDLDRGDRVRVDDGRLVRL